MADVKEFNALRFTEKAGDISSLTCLPYDIISRGKRQEYLNENPYNIVRLELPKGENRYEEAGETLRKWLKEKILKKDDIPAFYIYEIEFDIDDRHALSGVPNGRRSVMGIVGLLKLEEFEKGVVIPHEETLSKAKTDRFNLMKSTHCNFSNIYTLYKNPEKNKGLNINRLVKNRVPLSEMTDEEGLVHRIWAITDIAEIEGIKNGLRDKELYIADGHHRYETALNFRDYTREKSVDVSKDVDYVMNMMVDMGHPCLVVFPTHRMIHSIKDFDAEKLLSQCEEFFEVERDIPLNSLEERLEEEYKKENHAFAFYTGNEKFSLLVLKENGAMDKAMSGKSDASKSLDVAILHTLILEKLLYIDKENLANQTNLEYTRSLDEAIHEVEKGNFQCSFILNPTRVSEISDVAEAGEKMPQKSTYFYPKLITGLTMNRFAAEDK